MLPSWVIKTGSNNDSENKRAILKLLEPKKNARVLDLGCGDGTFTQAVGKRIGTDQLYGVDIRERLVKKCISKGINAQCGDLNDPLPFESNTFDVVIINQVWEHLYKTDFCLAEIHRVLALNGCVVISVPNLAAWHNIACLFLGWLPVQASLSDVLNIGNPIYRNCHEEHDPYPKHYRLPTYTGIKELLLYSGFPKVKVIGTGYYPFPAVVARVMSIIDPLHSVLLTAKARKG